MITIEHTVYVFIYSRSDFNMTVQGEVKKRKKRAKIEKWECVEKERMKQNRNK